MPRYSIKKNRIKKGCLHGFAYNEDTGKLVIERDSIFHCIFLRGIDSTLNGSEWGRISFLTGGSDDMICCVYVAALDFNDMELDGEIRNIDDYLCDPATAPNDKIMFLKRMGAVRHVGSNDVLLYELKGRYLYTAIEVNGEGDLSLWDIKVDSTGDNFMQTFPEIYRERNSFFHRYMSIYSSIYNDFGDKIEHLPDMLDIDTCPPELLIEYAGWMGIDLKGGFLEEEAMRTIVREAYSLNRMKGTRRSIERILEIILKEDSVIIEHNQVRSHISRESRDYPPSFEPKSIYDVTILVRSKLTEELRHQLMYMIRQFIPVRTRINIAQMDEHVIIDSNTYLDINARLPESQDAVLDEGSVLSDMIVLK